MNKKNLNINIFFGLSYFIISFFSSITTIENRLNQPSAGSLALDVTIKSCPGKIIVNPVGGVAPFSYSWETRATPADPWQTFSVNGVPYTSRIINGASPGDYRVTVKD